MAIVSDVEIRLRADVARLRQDMADIRRTTSNGMDSVAAAVDKAKSTLKGLAAGLGLKELASQVMQAQREFDKMNGQLVTATGSAKNAGLAFNALQAFAATTPFDLKQTTEAFVQLRNLGLTPSERALTSFGNTASAKSKQLSEVVEAVADAATGEFERLKEAFGVTAVQMGDRVALSFQGSTAVIAKNAKEIQAYLVKIGEVQFGGAMARQANTLDGAISNLGDTWQSTLRTISTNGIGDATISGVLALSAALGDLSAILDTVGGVAHKEGEIVKEAGVIHQALTTTFEAISVVGINVVHAFTQIGLELVGLAKQAEAVARGDFAGAKAIGKQVDADAKAALIAVEAKSAAILTAAKRAQETREKEEAARKAAGKDQLEQFAIELTAEQKREQAKLAIIKIEEKVTGVTADSLAEITKLNTALETGAITQARYNFLKGKLTEAMYQGSLAGKDEIKSIERSSVALKQRAEILAVLNEREVARIAHAVAMGQLNEDDALKQSGAVELKILKDQRSELEGQLALAKRKHENQTEQIQLQGQIAALGEKTRSKEIEQQQKLEALEHRRYLEAANNYADIVEAAQEQSRAQKMSTRDMQDEIATIGLTEKQLAALTAQRKRDEAAILDQRAAVQDLTDFSGALGAESRKQAEELRKQADLVVSKEQLERVKDFWTSIDSTAHDTFVSIANGGKDTATRLKETFKNVFFDWLYQMTLKKWIISLSGSVNANAVGALTGGTGGGAGGVTSLLSAGKMLFDGFSTGFAKLSTVVADSVQSGMYATGMSSNILTNGPFATMVGDVAASAAGALAGRFIGNTIAGDYKVAHGQAITNIASIAGSIFGGPIGGVIGGTIGGLINRAFGMGSKNVSGTALNGNLAGNGFSGSFDSPWTQKGGWFRSDKSGVDKTAVDAAVASTLGETYAAITAASAQYATVLGLNADAIASRAQNISIAMGKDEAANQKAITDFFVGVGDAIARELLPNIAAFQQEGEAASTTLQRLASDFQAVGAVLSMMGTTSEKAFGATGAAAVAANERLLALAGGVQALATQAQYFADNFLTQAEKVAPAQKQMTDVLGALGYGYVKTTDQYKQAVLDLARSGALATESGAATYAALLQLAPAFKTVTDYTNELKQAALDSARDGASAALDALSKAVDAQKDVVTAAYNDAMAVLDAGITRLNDTIGTTAALSKALKDGVASVDTPAAGIAGRQVAVAQIGAALAIAKASGMLPSADSLADALSAIKATSADQFGSLVEYQRSVAQANNAIEQLGGLADDQLSAADLQLAATIAQKDALTAANDTQLARLDALVTAAQSQVAAINGVDTSVQTLYQALTGVYTAAQTLSGLTGISATAVSPSNAGSATIDSNALLAELQTLNARIANMESHAATTAGSTGKLAQQFDQVSAGGNSLLTQAA